jgi:hypothetical protein
MELTTQERKAEPAYPRRRLIGMRTAGRKPQLDDEAFTMARRQGWHGTNEASMAASSHLLSEQESKSKS